MAESQGDNITILLGLEGYRVGKLRDEGKGLVVEVEVEVQEALCPHCGGKGYGHGLGKGRDVLHSWSSGKRVYLRLKRRRFRCRDCGGSFTQTLPLLRPYSRLTRMAEAQALWELQEGSFSRVRRRLGVSYSTMRRILEREVSGEALSLLEGEGTLSLGIDEHSFRHQDMVYTVTEVKKRWVLGILRDDRIASLKAFLSPLPPERVREVCIDMKGGLWKVIQGLFPRAKVVVDPFHVIADANKRLDEARRLEQEMRGRKVSIPKRVFLVGKEKLKEGPRQRVEGLLAHYPNLKGFYWAKEELRALYREEDRVAATKRLDNIILNLKAGEDAELVRWGNTLKRWREPILNHFDNGTTNGFTEGCHTKIKMLKRLSYGLRNVEVYARKMLLGFLPAPFPFHTN